MRVESTGFQSQDVRRFVDELAAHERDLLAGRLERASERLAGLALRLAGVAVGAAGAGADDWTAVEVLAHIAALSKFYGMVGYKVGTGALTEIDLLGQVGQRDVVGEQLARLPAPQLVEMGLGRPAPDPGVAALRRSRAAAKVVRHRGGRLPHRRGLPAPAPLRPPGGAPGSAGARPAGVNSAGPVPGLRPPAQLTRPV